jgi:hypothetical protein
MVANKSERLIVYSFYWKISAEFGAWVVERVNFS